MLAIEPNRPPVLLGRWEILGILDASGATRQYLAWDNETELWRIVRTLAFRRSRDILHRTRFEREVRSLERIRHPNVIAIIASDPTHETMPWAVTEVAEGGTLAEWIALHGPMPAYQGIDVMAQVCNGLSAAHREGLSHGGLRQESVLFDRLGACKVTGFRGSGERGDIQADVKAAGALLFTMLTGRPWDDGHAAQLLAVLPQSLARPVEMTRRGRGGYADVSTFSRDLEAAVLEIPAPSGTVPPLVGADAALPDDPAEVWDPDAKFPDLAHYAAFARDASYEPSGPEEADDPVTNPPIVSQAAAPAAAEAPSASTARLPYVMSRPSDRKAEARANAEAAASVSGQPLYIEDEPVRERWSYDASQDPELVKEKPEPVVEQGPMITDAILVRLIAVAVAFLFLAVISSVMYGGRLVGEARGNAEAAGSALVSAVRQESGLVYDLANVGADRKPLEDAYFAFDGAKNEATRLQAAVAFCEIVEGQAQAARIDRLQGGGAVNETVQRVDQLHGLHVGYVQQRAAWEQRARGFPGVLAVLARVEYAPQD